VLDLEPSCLDPRLICLKLGRYIFCRLCDEEIYLGVACAIIDVDDVELDTSNAVFHGSTEIRVYEFEGCCGAGRLCWDHMLLLFRFDAGFA